jgi:hypothetical protein
MTGLPDIIVSCLQQGLVHADFFFFQVGFVGPFNGGSGVTWRLPDVTYIS